MIQSFHDLQVYEESYRLALEVYRASEAYPKEERYGLASQIQRAAISIPLNLAEGYGKHESAAEFKRYIRMAMGSANEIEVLLNLLKDLGYMTVEKAEELKEKYIAARKQLYRLQEKWN